MDPLAPPVPTPMNLAWIEPYLAANDYELWVYTRKLCTVISEMLPITTKVKVESVKY